MYRGDRSRKRDVARIWLIAICARQPPLRFDEFRRSTNVSSSSVLRLVTTNSNKRLVQWLSKYSPDRTCRSSLRDCPSKKSGGPSSRGDPSPDIKGSAGSGDYTYQTNGRRSHRLLRRPAFAYATFIPTADTLDRIELLKALRLGEFDVLVGINLFEWFDSPEVAFIAILDADKEGFLRSERSLIQTIGRAARNVEGRVFALRRQKTRSIDAAVSETERLLKNGKYNIMPSIILHPRPSAARSGIPTLINSKHRRLSNNLTNI